MRSHAAFLLLSAILLAGSRAEETMPADHFRSEPGILGLGLAERDGRIVVDKLFAATPASRQDVIRVGDRIDSITQDGGKPVAVGGMKMPQVIQLLRGRIDSRVRIAAVRPGEDDQPPREVMLTRQPAPESAFSPGDPAPAWQTGAWIKGEPVTGFDPDHVYLIECWATWCQPCVAGIPRLNRLHREYRDRGLVVIGQNICQKDESAVREFVDSMGDKMSYRVAMDEIPASARDNSCVGKMADAWLQPGKMPGVGVHVAFLVGKDGGIAWSGAPEKLGESVIEAALAAPKGSPCLIPR